MTYSVIIPDDRFFKPQEEGEKVKKMTINLEKLRKALVYGFELHESPFTYLARRNGNSPFSFVDPKKRPFFRIRTKQSASGAAPIAISFWIDGRPLDEFSFALCVKSDPSYQCETTDRPYSALRGIDLRNYDDRPDAALQLFQLNNNHLIGVFRCNTCGWGSNDYQTWRLEFSPAKLRENFIRTALPAVQMAAHGPDINQGVPHYNPQMLERAGSYLYSLLFKNGDDSEEIFRKFVSEQIARTEETKKVPSIFFRLLPIDGTDFFSFQRG